LDEPTNGLDPAGILEMRELITRLASEQGLTVFLSSHLLSEVEQVATHIGVVENGRLRFQGTVQDLHAQVEEHVVLKVQQPKSAQKLLQQSGWTVRHNGNSRLAVKANSTSDAALINRQLVENGLNVYHLQLEQPTLEDIFLTLTNEKHVS
jgi:ABC-2 type transport system ATP-binding protein